MLLFKNCKGHHKLRNSLQGIGYVRWKDSHVLQNQNLAIQEDNKRFSETFAPVQISQNQFDYMNTQAGTFML